MKIRRRSLLLCGLILLLMVCGATLAASRAGERRLVTVMDCTADCVTRRDSSLDKCNQMPENLQQRCRDNVNKQYDRCIERCKSGSSSAPQKDGR